MNCTMTDNSECEVGSDKGVLTTVLISLALAIVMVACCTKAFLAEKVEFGYRVVDRDLAPLLESSLVFYKTSADPVYSGRQLVRVNIGRTSPDGFVNVALPGKATDFRLDVAFQNRPKMFLSRKELVLEVDVAGKRREVTLRFREDKPFYAWENFSTSDYSSVDFNVWACMSAFCLGWIFMFMGVSLLGRMRSVHANVLFVCAFVAVCALPSVKMDKSPSSSRENRNLAKFPDVEDVRGEGLSAWCRKFEAAFADRFWGRGWLMDVHSAIMEAFDNMGNTKVLVGRDGWLFLRSTLADFSNSAPMYDERTMEKIRGYLESIGSYAKSRNKKFVFFIAPDKCRVYPEYVRRYRKVRPDSESRTERLVAYLRERCDFPVVYPREEMLGMKESSPFPLYYKSDTHWNSMGAYLGGYLPIMRALSFADIRVVKVDDWREPKHWGDLLGMLGRKPSRQELASLSPKWTNGTYAAPRPGYNPGTKVAFESDRRQKGDVEGRVVARNPSCGGFALYCIRDSFCTDLLPFFSESFARTTARHVLRGVRPEDKAQIDECNAILLEIAERDLLNLANASLPAQFGKEVR